MSPKVFGVRRRPSPCPVAGASTITRSYLDAPLHAAVELGQLPDLPDRDQLAQPGSGRGEVGEDAVLEHQVVDRLDPDLHLQVLLQRALRIDREREQVLADLGLAVADALAVEHVGHALLLRHLADDRALPVPRGGHAERGRDGRLARRRPCRSRRSGVFRRCPCTRGGGAAQRTRQVRAEQPPPAARRLEGKCTPDANTPAHGFTPAIRAP